MATTIRLSRHGAKKNPFYRIIVTDSRAPRDGRRLDQIGTYDPHADPFQVKIQEEKLAQWLRKGARPSQTVAQLIRKSGLSTRAAAAASTPAPDPGETQA